MALANRKENELIEKKFYTPTTPTLPTRPSGLAPPVPPREEAEPRASTETVRSLNIAENIPRIISPMDAEDSPWGEVKAKSPQAALSASSTPRSPVGRNPRTRGKVAPQTTRLEAIDDSLGPLGPLGETSNISEPETPPAPPSKEQPLPIRNTRSQQATPSSASHTVIDSTDLVDDERGSVNSRHRFNAQGYPENINRQAYPSVSIEQAARPTFDITVGDPHKVGDLTTSHIVYQVRTRTTSKAYKQHEFAVTRRYKDFLWLYNSLHSSNPGVVVPPPPEKQAVGRFDINFVESRRQALEKMLNKTAAHPILQHDGDLKIFLESDAFNMDVKHREHKELGLGESKGMLSSLGLSSTSTGKFIEHDDWFHDRKIYLDALESQLKALLKSIDMVVAQRKALAEAAGDFSASLHALSTVELSVSLSIPLEGLSDLQLRIRELYERQAQQDVLTLGITVDEYIRLIGSIKTAFSQRQKSFHSWHSAEAELHKRRVTQEKILRSGKTQQDRLNQLQADVSDGERRSHQARLLFEDMGRLMRGELERFEREKVEDFKSGVETFLEGAIEAQKELIELWETFLMQLDADEDGEPFFKPPAITPPPIRISGEAEAGDNHASQQQPDEASQALGAGETDQAAAATATVEQEE